MSTFRRDWAYARHEVRRRFRPQPPGTAEEVLAAFERDGLQPLRPAERDALPAMSRCIDCGLCALVLRRAGGVRPPELAGAYLRDLTLLPAVAADLEVSELSVHALATAAAVCPVGVPLDQVAAMLRRLAGHR